MISFADCKKTKRYALRIIMLGLLGGMLLLPSAASGMWDVLPALSEESLQLALSSELDLEPVTLAEFLHAVELASQSMDAGRLRVQSFRGRGRFHANQLRAHAAQKGILRTVSSLWRISMPASLSVQNLRVRYTLTACSGRAHHLSDVEHPSAAIRVTIEPTTPRVVARDRSSGTVIVEGGAKFRLFPSLVDAGGAYCGTLRVTIQKG